MFPGNEREIGNYMHVAFNGFFMSEEAFGFYGYVIITRQLQITVTCYVFVALFDKKTKVNSMQKLSEMSRRLGVLDNEVIIIMRLILFAKNNQSTIEQ